MAPSHVEALKRVGYGRRVWPGDDEEAARSAAPQAVLLLERQPDRVQRSASVRGVYKTSRKLRGPSAGSRKT